VRRIARFEERGVTIDPQEGEPIPVAISATAGFASRFRTRRRACGATPFGFSSRAMSSAVTPVVSSVA